MVLETKDPSGADELSSTLIQCVSIPRSGHHYLVRLLRRYFRLQGRASERHRLIRLLRRHFNPKGRVKRFGYCEYYNCCRVRPCALYSDQASKRGVAVYFQKSHDEYLRRFDLDYEPPLAVCNQGKHIVQIRNPVSSVISDFELELSKNQSNDGSSKQKIFRPTSYALSDWQAFAPQEFEYRNRFLEKWVLTNPWLESGQFHVLDYDNFLARHDEKLRELIEFVLPNEPVNQQLLRRAIERNPAKPKRDPNDFQFAETLGDYEPLYKSTWEACKEKLGLEKERL